MVPSELNKNTEAYIVERQSSFVRICTAENVQYKIDFKGKLEFSLEEKSFKGVTVSHVHPLMKHHQQRKLDIYISSPHDNPRALAKHFENMVQYEYDGWRGIGECFNSPENLVSLLSGGFGLLYRGPEELGKEVELILKQSGVKHSTHHGVVKDKMQLMSLNLGGNVVIANEFIFKLEMS